MKPPFKPTALLTLLTCLLMAVGLHAQTTAFTYQGRLVDNGAPANGEYDMTFRLHDALAAGNPVGAAIQVAPVTVAGGVFTVTLDFGGTPFIGFDRWLEIGVRPNGSQDAHTLLAPRQAINSTPYATFAGGVNSSGIIGQLTDSQLSTTLSVARTFPNPNNQFTGTFTGDGSGLTSLSAGNLVGALALGLDPSVTGAHSGVAGGQSNSNNAIRSLIGAGIGNTISSGANIFLGAGGDNEARGLSTFLGAGADNFIDSNAGVLVGGIQNANRGNYSFLGAGSLNSIASGAQYAVIAGGQDNQVNANYGFAGGRRAGANHEGAFVWADATGASFGSTAANQFLVRAGGGVGINKNNPQTALDVNGTVTASAFAGNGSALTGIPAANLTGAINPANIAAGTIQSSMLADGAVGAAQLAVNSVTSGALADGSVSTAKLAGGSVDSNALADGSVNAAKIAVSGSTLTATIAYPQSFQQTPTVSIQSPGWNPATAGTASFNASFPGYGAVPLEVSGFIFATKGNSSVLDLGGRPAIAYYGSGNSLKFLLSDKVDGRGSWFTNTVATGSIGLYTSMILVDGKPAIATCTGDGNTLVYAYSSTSSGLDSWSTVIVDNSSLVGAYCSMQLVDGMPAIAYYDTTAGHLKFARASALDGSGAWAIDVVDDGGGAANVGRYCSMAIVGGRPAVSYYDATSGDLKYARASSADGSGAWTIQTIDSVNDAGYWTGLAVIGGKPAIAYSENNGGTLKYAAATTTDGSGAWNVSTVWASSGVNASLMEWNGRPLISARTVAGGRFAAGIWYNAQPDGSGSWTRTFLNSFDSKDHGLRSGLTLLNGVPAVSYHHGAQGNNGQLHFATVPALDWAASDGAVAPVLAAGVAQGADGSGLTSLNAAALTGLVPASTIPELSADRITSGTFDAGLLPDLDASKITSGTVADARLDASIARSANVWSKSGNAGTTPGTDFIGTTDNKALVLKVNNQTGLQIVPTGSVPNFVAGGGGSVTGVGGAIGGGSGHVINANYATVGGGLINNVTGVHGTVAGGRNNTASGTESTVGGGLDNSATSDTSTVGGGLGNSAESIHATVGGGNANEASGFVSTIAGGELNVASAAYATVPGGRANAASGEYTFAAGRRAKAAHQGAFVWADSNDADFASTADNQFNVRASGGYRLASNSDASAGVSLAAGSGTWASLSDRNAKENIAPIDGKSVLEKVAALPIAIWNYKTQNNGVKHVGPMAQDFRAAFGLGENETTITTVDADGVALAAIQGLNQVVQEKDAQIKQLEKRLAELEKVMKAVLKK